MWTHGPKILQILCLSGAILFGIFSDSLTALLAAGLYRSRNIVNFTYEYVNDIIALNLSDIKICVLSAKFFRDLVPLLCVVCINTNL